MPGVVNVQLMIFYFAAHIILKKKKKNTAIQMKIIKKIIVFPDFLKKH